MLLARKSVHCMMNPHACRFKEKKQRKMTFNAGVSFGEGVRKGKLRKGVDRNESNFKQIETRMMKKGF